MKERSSAGEEFTAYTLAEELNAKAGSIQNVIARLLEKNTFSLVEPGAGRRAAIYKVNSIEGLCNAIPRVGLSGRRRPVVVLREGF